MENTKNISKLNLEYGTQKKSELATSDDQKSKSTATKARVQATSTRAKASEQYSRLAPTPHNDLLKPPISVGAANQPVQPDVLRLI